MKKLILSVMVAFVAMLGVSSCGKDVSDAYVYSITNSFKLGSNAAQVSAYVESCVSLSETFVATETVDAKAADKEGKAWFETQLSGIDDATMQSMMNSGEYYELTLIRTGASGNYVNVQTRRWVK